ncbi:MAG: 3'-5' exonuclease [Patescibacteria group bacterium]
MPFLLDPTGPDFRSRPILFIDLEVTGLDRHQHEIVEIAALRVDQPDFTVTNSFYTKVIPEHIETADPKALSIINYSKEAWVDAIPLQQAIEELAAFAPDSILAGWSVQTEWDFLCEACLQLQIPYFFTHRLLEVYTLAFVHFYKETDMKYINLSKVSKALGIPLDQHKPDSDVRATYEIFKKLFAQQT